MSGPYWSQWDRDDLDSWQGKDYPYEEEEDLPSNYWLGNNLYFGEVDEDIYLADRSELQQEEGDE